MNKLYRIIDANINRASEGLRVLEDIARFYYDDKELSEKLKGLRHNVRKGISEFAGVLLSERESSKDVGLEISKELKIDGKTSVDELIISNFKRLQEALRTIEETLKVLNHYELSKAYEDYRFLSYTLEKSFGKSNRARFVDTGIYCITGHEFSNGRSNIEVVSQMIEAGIKVIQYREKDKKLKEKYEECIAIREMTKKAGVTFIVNDDIDLAILVKADGVHIGQDDLPIEKVRELVGPDMIIGLSTHLPQQAHDAVKRGADYIGVGPIYKTNTKKDVGEPVGLDYLSYVAKNIKIPFVAIGGIKEHNILEVKEAGANWFALVTEIVGAEDIKEAINSLRNKIED